MLRFCREKVKLYQTKQTPVYTIYRLIMCILNHKQMITKLYNNTLSQIIIYYCIIIYSSKMPRIAPCRVFTFRGIQIPFEI